MNKGELIDKIAKDAKLTKSQAGDALDSVLNTVSATLTKGGKVTLVGFGTFERRNRQARTGRNPRTLAPLRIPSSRVPAFRAGQELKDIVNGNMRQKAYAAQNKSSSKPAVKSAKKTTKASKGRKR